MDSEKHGRGSSESLWVRNCVVNPGNLGKLILISLLQFSYQTYKARAAWRLQNIVKMAHPGHVALSACIISPQYF